MNLQGKASRGRSAMKNQNNRGPLGYFIQLAKEMADECERKCGKGKRGIRCRKQVKKCKDNTSVKTNS